jgi:dihydroorotate dehydrogenase
MIDIFPVAGALLRALPAELAHRLTVEALARGVVPKAQFAADAMLEQQLWGLSFPHPVGLAAGFDKNAEVADAMLAQGFSFVEVGTITLRPQIGNRRPRIFRLTRDEAMINRLGFNNAGLAAAARRLAHRRTTGKTGIVGANIGPNRDAKDPIADLARAAATLTPYVDYLAINVSSPNTPGLRAWQQRQGLSDLIAGVNAHRAHWSKPVPLLVKVAPDLDDREIAAIAEVVLAGGVDGLIATNTTIERPPQLQSRARDEEGGLSGRPLMRRATQVLAKFRMATLGQVPLIGVGGIASGADAYAKIRAGASLIQLYTALVYQGPRLVQEICRDLAERLRADGFPSLTAAVGTAAVAFAKEETVL